MSKKLVADGMWFVGIDVIGDKVVEINSDSPAGCRASNGFTRSTSAQPSSKPWSAGPPRRPESLPAATFSTRSTPVQRSSRSDVGSVDFAGTVRRDRAAEEVDGNRLVAQLRQPMAEVDLRVAAALHAMEHQHGRGIRMLAGHQNSVEVEAGVLIVEGKRRQVGHAATVPTADPSAIRRSLSAYRPTVSTSPCRGRPRSGCPRSWPTRRSPARPRRPKPLRAS